MESDFGEEAKEDRSSGGIQSFSPFVPPSLNEQAK
jgi:hypothetical protein